jgi:hypothetical protein
MRKSSTHSEGMHSLNLIRHPRTCDVLRQQVRTHAARRTPNSFRDLLASVLQRAQDESAPWATVA